MDIFSADEVHSWSRDIRDSMGREEMKSLGTKYNDPFHPFAGRRSRRNAQPKLNKQLDIETLRPPSDAREDRERYSHLQENGAEANDLSRLRPSSLAKQDSWRILECSSPRSPTAKLNQLYELRISGRESDRCNRTNDFTLATLQPGINHHNATWFHPEAVHRLRLSTVNRTETRRSSCGSFHAGSVESKLEASQGLENSLQSILNTYDRVLLVLGERLRELEQVAADRPRRANSSTCRELWARLMRDTHKLYTLLIASLILFEKDEDLEKPRAETKASSHRGSKLDVHEFDNYNYDTIVDETSDYRITLKTLQRWYTPNGRIHCAFESLRQHLRNVKRQGLDINQLNLSERGFQKIDEATTRCLERLNGLQEAIQRFDLHVAATTVIAAMRWRKLSPK